MSFAGGDWVERFDKVCNHPNVTIYRQPEQLGPVKDEDNAYERSNLWVLYSTLMYPMSQVRLIALWDGKEGDGPGGTRHMVEEMLKHKGAVTHLDTTKFDYWSSRERDSKNMAPDDTAPNRTQLDLPHANSMH